MIELKSFLAAYAFSFLATGSAFGQGMPSASQNSKSQSECSDWAHADETWWGSFLVKVHQNDAACKAHYKGPYTTVQSLCANTVGGPVTHQNPCDEGTKFTECEWIGFFRSMGLCLSRVADSQRHAKANSSGAIEVEVSARAIPFDDRAG